MKKQVEELLKNLKSLKADAMEGYLVCIKEGDSSTATNCAGLNAAYGIAISGIEEILKNNQS